MATATWTITTADIYDLLRLATRYNNDQYALSFAAGQIPNSLAQTFVDELLDLHEHKTDTFEPWGRQLARWANTSVPIVEAVIAANAEQTPRLTETGDERVTENGSVRIIEE